MQRAYFYLSTPVPSPSFFIVALSYIYEKPIFFCAFSQLLCIPLFHPTRLLRSSNNRACQGPPLLLILPSTSFYLSLHCFFHFCHPSIISYFLQAMTLSLRRFPRWVTILARSLTVFLVLALHTVFLTYASRARKAILTLPLFILPVVLGSYRNLKEYNRWLVYYIICKHPSLFISIAGK